MPIYEAASRQGLVDCERTEPEENEAPDRKRPSRRQTVYRVGVRNLLIGVEDQTVHAGHGAVVDAATGAVILRVGDPTHSAFPRSSLKFIQALGLVETGAADHFDLGAVAGLTDRRPRARGRRAAEEDEQDSAAHRRGDEEKI